MCDDENIAYEQALAQIKACIDAERAVLVFLEDSDSLDKFYKFAAPSLGQIHMLDNLKGERHEKGASMVSNPRAPCIAHR